MKILLLNQAFFPDSVSTSQHVTDLARDLHANGHAITVLCGRRDYTDRKKRYPRFELVDGVTVHRVNSTGFGKGRLAARMVDAASYDLMALWRLLRLPRQDLVVAFTSPPLVGLHGALAARLWRARFVHWLMNINHEMAMELGDLRRTSLLGWALTAIYRITLRASDRVVVMDRFMKARVEREHVVDPQRIVIVPVWSALGPDDHDHASRQDSDRFKQMFAGKFTVVHSGNLSHINPIDTVLDAAVRLKDDPSTVFVFIGHGARERDIDDVVRRHRLTNIRKLPYQTRERLRESLGFADLHMIVMGNATSGLAHASKIYSILESGRPYLYVGPRESHIVDDVLVPCPTGFHVENGDVDGLVKVIERVKRLTDEDRQKISEKNRAFVAAHFSRQSCIARFIEQVLGDEVEKPASAAVGSNVT